MSTAEAEYVAAALCCMSLAHFRSLQYDFENLGTDNYDVNKETTAAPTILLVDNSATVEMSKNYKQTKKNRHIARRYHYVRQGTRLNLHKLLWIKNDDQLADDKDIISNTITCMWKGKQESSYVCEDTEITSDEIKPKRSIEI